MVGGARFRYSVRDGAGSRFVRVDPAAGTREPAFDHDRPAATSGRHVDPGALPLAAFERPTTPWSPHASAAFDAYRRCRPDTYTCESAAFPTPGNPLEVPSPDGATAVSGPVGRRGPPRRLGPRLRRSSPANRTTRCTRTTRCGWPTPHRRRHKLLVVPDAEHTFIDCLGCVRGHCPDFLVRALTGTQPSGHRPAPW